MRRATTPAAAAVVAGGVLLAGLLLGGCQQDLTARAQFGCPDKQIFVDYVSPLMERRCGTLDCHGSDFRPMRLYGELGLRHPAETNRAGGNATTLGELEANYRAICAIEPEKISAVAGDPGGQSVNRLLLVRKGRGQEGHKGGKVFNPFDDADLCVVGWLRGDNQKSVAAACEAALDNLP